MNDMNHSKILPPESNPRKKLKYCETVEKDVT